MISSSAFRFLISRVASAVTALTRQPHQGPFPSNMCSRALAGFITLELENHFTFPASQRPEGTPGGVFYNTDGEIPKKNVGGVHSCRKIIRNSLSNIMNNATKVQEEFRNQFLNVQRNIWKNCRLLEELLEPQKKLLGEFRKVSVEESWMKFLKRISESGF